MSINATLPIIEYEVEQDAINDNQEIQLPDLVDEDLNFSINEWSKMIAKCLRLVGLKIYFQFVPNEDYQYIDELSLMGPYLVCLAYALLFLQVFLYTNLRPDGSLSFNNCMRKLLFIFLTFRLRIFLEPERRKLFRYIKTELIRRGIIRR
ncbi:hypothetical protein DFJ63DRAFT_315622 [Scheffersomyces coipomensis]|uniref:uncharacterized protein n=1 Tax=Scheffersomyces coipomensis TaxID=1788519 RepID=UPI00315D6A74